MTIVRLVITDRARGFSRTNGNIKISKGRWKEFADLGNRHGEVGIANKNILAQCFANSTQYSAALAALFVMDHTQVFMLVREFLRKFKCFVGTAVFNNNYFRGIVLFFEKMKHLLKGIGQ